jgi:gluconolactonase
MEETMHPMHRRAFLTAAAVAASAATVKAAPVTERALGEQGVPLRPTEPLPLGPLPGSRYPDPHVENEKKIKGGWSSGSAGFPGFAGTMAVERVATGFRWAEGPVYFPAGRYVLFSDIPNNRIMRLCEDDDHLSVYRRPSMNSNGNTIDREGRLITCEHSGRRVTRTELDGSIIIIADKYNGKKLNSPNDVAVASDGSIWFTDPVYGIGGFYEGIKEAPEQEKHNVYRVDPRSGEVKVIVDDFVEPNGICFSPDEKKLYVIDTGYTDGPNNPSHIRVFDVDVEGGKASNGKVFVDNLKPNITDGMRADSTGNIWCSIGWGEEGEDGVRCYSPSGDLLGKIHIPETVANLCFGGQQRNRLYICGSTSLYAVYTSAQGALKP